ALAPMIEAAAGRTEKERKIPADVLSAMHACGLFHMLLPVSLGGAAVDLVTFNQVVEAVVALGIAGSCLAAFMQLAPTQSSGRGLGSTAVLRDNVVIPSRVAPARGQLGS